MSDNLQQRVDALNARHSEIKQTLSRNLANVATRRETLGHEIEELRSELAKVDAEFLDLQEELTVFSEVQQQHATAALVAEALAQSRQELFDHLDELQQIRAKRAQINNEWPHLAQELEEYQRFEETRRDLSELPDSYRSLVLTHHDQRRQRLQPHLDLLEREGLFAEQMLKIPLVMISNPKESQINWVLPIPDKAEDYPAAIAGLLDELTEQFVYVILRLGQHADWYFAGMEDESTSWQGFFSQTTLMEYSGEEEIVKDAARIIQEQLDRLLTSDQAGRLQGQKLVAEIVSIAQSAIQWTDDLIHLASPRPQKEPETPLLTLIESSHGWYSDNDVKAWERPLKVTEASSWNVQGRRLRTMLIQFLSRGLVGSDHADKQILWQALPAPHQEAMRAGVERLVEQSILLSGGDSNGTGEVLVTINPTMIGRVQDLINRQVDGVWQQIIDV